MGDRLEIADLFCGAGGTSTGAIQAALELGFSPRLTAVNHWPTAVATHSANHPDSRHVCASVDSVNPRHLYPDGGLDLLWASPECTHHSRARGGRPVSDQTRASAHCVVRWAEALQPGVILVENVQEFLDWGPISAAGRPIKSKRGAAFRAWVVMLEALGYKVEWRVLCAADFGDPTTRERLFIQAVRGRRLIRWPEPTHARLSGTPDMFCQRKPWRAAREIIDWSIPSQPISERKRPLAANTMKRIVAGLRKFGLGPFIAAWDHQSGTGIWSLDRPLSSITTKARHGICEPFLVQGAHCGSGDLFEPALLPQQSGGRLRPISEPVPTVSTGGAIALIEPFLVEYYSTATVRSTGVPLGTVTTKPRFGLCSPQVAACGRTYRLDIRFRMLQPRELAAAQGFPEGYAFSGTKADVVCQIGNAVPCGLAKSLVRAVLQERVR